MENIKCINCGELSNDSNVCQHCGSRLATGEESVAASSNESYYYNQDDSIEISEKTISEQNTPEDSTEPVLGDNNHECSKEDTSKENDFDSSNVTTSETDNTMQESIDTSEKHETIDSTESPCTVECNDGNTVKEDNASSKINKFVETLKNDKKKLYIFIAVIVVLIGIVFLVANNINKSNYQKNMAAAHTKMIVGGASAEEACNLIKSVWYDTIWDKYDSETSKYTFGTDDFNVSLNKLFSDTEFQADLQLIRSNQQEVGELMDKLKNPPTEYEKSYEALLEMYANYLRLTNLALSPEGSLTSFSSEFREADSALANSYSFVENLLP